MNEKMMKTIGIIIGSFVVFIIIIFLVAKCGKGSHSYEQLEAKMLKVAKSYYKDNEKELPKENKDTATITLKKLISESLLPEVSEYIGDENAKCDGNVTVINNGGYYLYIPSLSCGKEYQTKTLKDKIIESSLVETGVGLYQVNEEYIFKGEVTDNYVKIGEDLYRIMRINTDGTIKLLTVTNKENYVWDDRYNAQTDRDSGINDFVYNNLNSRIKDTLEELYNSDKFNDDYKSHIVSQDLCIGKRSEDDASKDGSTECENKISEQYLGLIAVYEYLQASLSPSCERPMDPGCDNYNWMSGIKTWTITANKDNPNKVWKLLETFMITNASSSSKILPTIVLNDSTVYEEGTGTETDPYIITISKK